MLHILDALNFICKAFYGFFLGTLVEKGQKKAPPAFIEKAGGAIEKP